MEQYTLDKIESLRKENYHVDRLYKEHLELEEKIEELTKRLGLSAEEQNKLHQLKKKKLAGKEELLKLIETH